MSPVDYASRHYQGPGLGEAAWRCPACGVENVGPIGPCPACGAGQPGYRPDPGTPPPAPPRPTAHLDAEPEPRIERSATPSAQGDVATLWARAHPDATIEEAYRAGMLDAQRELQRALRETAAAATPKPETWSPEGRVARTLIAALTLFRDQVLVADPEEVGTGEWCSAKDIDGLIAHFTKQLQQESHG